MNPSLGSVPDQRAQKVGPEIKQHDLGEISVFTDGGGERRKVSKQSSLGTRQNIAERNSLNLLLIRGDLLCLHQLACSFRHSYVRIGRWESTPRLSVVERYRVVAPGELRTGESQSRQKRESLLQVAQLREQLVWIESRGSWRIDPQLVDIAIADVLQSQRAARCCLRRLPTAETCRRRQQLKQDPETLSIPQSCHSACE